MPLRELKRIAAMILPMREDRYHIEMEDVSPYPLERSRDCQEWEDCSQGELNQILDTLPEDKVKTFLGVLRNGSFPRLGDYFYRIRPKDRTYT